MAVKYLAGDRLSGTSTERANLTGNGPKTFGNTSWKLLDNTSNHSADAAPNTGEFEARDNLMILIDSGTTAVPHNAGASPGHYWGDGTTPNSYPSTTGADARRSLGQTGVWSMNSGNQYGSRAGWDADTTTTFFGVMFMKNITGEEKPYVGMGMQWDEDQSAHGFGGNQDTRGKFKSTSGQIKSMRYFNESTGNSTTGLTWRILGCDDDEASTTQDKTGSTLPYWQELDSTELGASDGKSQAAGATITCNGSGSGFAAKKYLWVRLITIPNTTNGAKPEVFFNNVSSGGKYRYRYEDTTGTNDWENVTTTSNVNTFCPFDNSPHKSVHYTDMWIKNYDDQTKAILYQSLGGGLVGVSNATTSHADSMRGNCVFHSVTDDPQITRIDVTTNTSSGTFENGTMMKVWGGD